MCEREGHQRELFHVPPLPFIGIESIPLQQQQQQQQKRRKIDNIKTIHYNLIWN